MAEAKVTLTLSDGKTFVGTATGDWLPHVLEWAVEDAYRQSLEPDDSYLYGEPVRIEAMVE